MSKKQDKLGAKDEEKNGANNWKQKRAKIRT